MTGNFWILGDGELVGELRFIDLFTLPPTQYNRGPWLRGWQPVVRWAQASMPSLLPSRARLPNSSYDAARNNELPRSTLHVSHPAWFASPPVIRRSEIWTIGSDFGEAAVLGQSESPFLAALI